MFGFKVVDAKEYQRLINRDALFRRVESHMWWPHQRFVFDFLRDYVRGEDMGLVRDRFNRDLEDYVKLRMHDAPPIEPKPVEDSPRDAN